MRGYLTFLVVLFFLTGCQGQAPVSEAHAGPATQTTTQEGGFSLSVPGLSGPQQVMIGQGGEVSLGDSWLTRWNLDKLEVVKDGQIVAVGRRKEEGRWVLSDPSGNRLAKIKSRDDGGYKVVDADEKMVCKIKGREDGYKVVDSDEETVLLKVKYDGKKVKLKDGQGKELAKLRDTSDALSVAWLSIEKLPLPVRLAGLTFTWSGR